MRTFIHILIGFLIGVVCTLGVLYILALNNQRYLEAQNVPYNFCKVKTSKGIVTLHKGMPRDSVYFMLGNPASFETHTYQGHILELSGYRIKSKTIPDLLITFEDGVLSDVSKQSFPF